jgi:hypothetical protein
MNTASTSALRFTEAAFGTWQSDHERTLTELKRNLRPDHPKIQDYASHKLHDPLTIIRTAD